MATVIYDTKQLTTQLKDQLKARMRNRIEAAMDTAIKELKTELLADLPDIVVKIEDLLDKETKHVCISFEEK